MKKLTINTIRIQNFKGIKDFSIDPAGNDISVFGENGTGKTTLADAFSWLLFGKDSKDKADFQIKPVDQAGYEIHNLETIVEADLYLSGKAIRLKKVFAEKYTKKRGTAVSEFTGHSTDHFIDDVPVQKKDFDAKVSEIIDTKIFKIVTSPYGFASLPWTDRRAIILEMCGAMSDSDIINSGPGLSSLAAVLTDCSIDDHKKKVKARQAKINEELKQIPARISENLEASKNAVEPDGKEKTVLESALEENKEKLRTLRSNEAVSQKQIRINEIKGEIQAAKNNASMKLAESRKPVQDEINRLNVSLSSKKHDIQVLKDGIARDQKRVAVLAQAIDAARAKWYAEDGKNPEIKDTCPTCSQPLPEDQIQAAQDKFNIQKSERLAAISKEGKDSRQMHDKLLIDIQEAQAKAEAIEKEIETINVSIKALGEKVSIDTMPEVPEALQKELAALEMEISALKNGSMVQEQHIVEEISGLNLKMSAHLSAVATWDAAKKSFARIDELSAQEKTLAAEYERLESELFLIEKFIVKKVESMEDAINSKFKVARFKMFNQQINGGIEECCEICCGGVPFDRALNTGARLNTGLDIINTLSEHFGFEAPIFIDNAESCTDIIKANSQTIKLYVKQGVMELSVSLGADSKKDKAA